MSDYFDASINRVSDGTKSSETDVNNLRDEVGGAFDKLPPPVEISHGSVTHCTDVGSANVYRVSLPATATVYRNGMTVQFFPANTNTGASTLNIDGLGAKAIKGYDGADLSAGELITTSLYSFTYNGTHFVMHQRIANQILPTVSGKGDLPVFVNSGGTALEPISASSARTKLEVYPTTEVYTKAEANAAFQPADANLPTWPASVSATEVGYIGNLTYDVQEQLNTLKSRLDALQNTVGAQTGSLAYFTTQMAPAGYLEANGATVLRADYPGLWAHVQANRGLAPPEAIAHGVAMFGQYGPGDGSTTFTIPDLRGEFIRCFDNKNESGRGVDPDRYFGSWQADEFKAHAHGYTAVDTWGLDGGGGTPGYPKPNTTGPTGGSETRPRNVVLLACIKT